MRAFNYGYLLAAVGLLVIIGLAAWLLGRQGSGAAPELEGKTWKLVAINGRPPVSDRQPTISFNGGKVAGSTGVNQFGGNYRADGSTITLSDISSTLMASLDPALSDQEQVVLGALQGQLAYRVSGSQLELVAGSTTLVYSS